MHRSPPSLPSALNWLMAPTKLKAMRSQARLARRAFLSGPQEDLKLRRWHGCYVEGLGKNRLQRKI